MISPREQNTTKNIQVEKLHKSFLIGLLAIKSKLVYCPSLNLGSN